MLKIRQILFLVNGNFHSEPRKTNTNKWDFFCFKKDIQKIVEDNIQSLFSLELVASEFSLNGLRVDTLGFNKESRSFVIIEYKKDRNFTVIDQWYAYLALLLNNKAEFILKYNENNKAFLRKYNIDWSQSRVIFISPIFTTY